MRVVIRILAGAALCLGGLAAAAETPSVCAADPHARGLSGRIDNLRGFMDRIERSVDREEQSRLMEIHLKAMQENMRALRGRDVGEGCRMETMQAMLEQMLRHQLAAREAEDR